MALLAVSTAPADDDAALVEHLDQCAGCRAYRDEVRAIGQAHAAQAGEAPELAVSPGFHARLVRRIGEASSRRGRIGLPGVFGRPAFQLGAAACLLGLGLAWAWWQGIRPAPGARRDIPPPVQANGFPPSPAMAPPPTMARYHEVLSRSPDELEALLMREALRVPAGTPSTFSLRDRNVELLTRSDAVPPDTMVP